MTLDFGDVPSWVEAAATSFAFIGATILLLIERGRRKGERLEDQRKQAALVAHWLDKDDEDAWRLLFINSSKVPVYKIDFYLYVGNDFRGMISMARIEPGEARTRGKVDRWLNEGLAGIDASADIGIDFLFTDAESRNWVRDLNGLLVFLEQRDTRSGEERLRRYSVESLRNRLN